ncbi:MAG: hypothetical protein HC888_05565 [Candidatus Competibacteraceae bacterium]|nr:hypothetical protein [Candidatus Competibacteraceae bacterium]
MLFFLAVGFFGSGFGALAYYLVSEANRYKNYLSFTGKVIHTCTKGSHFAVIQSADPRIAQFQIPYSDSTDDWEGQDLAWMWDGQNSQSGRVDLRSNHKTSILFCCRMAGLALLLIILEILFPDLIGSSGSFAL